MFVFLIVLITLIAFILILLVLLQSGKGGGLAGIAAGGTTQILGARQAPDILEKATWVLAAAFIVLCILSSFAIETEGPGESVIQQRTRQGQTEQTTPILPPAGEQPAPATPPAGGDADASTPPEDGQ